MTEFERPVDFDAVLDGAKAVEAETNGDLIVEGYFATYDLDRQGEAFMPGSFGQAAKAFLAKGSRPLLAQHDPKLGQLGQVLSLEERSKGLWGRARIPEPAASSPLRDWYDKIRDGVTNGISIRTKMLMRKLADGTAQLLPRDILEFSMTPTPVNAEGVVAVAQKAFADVDDRTGDLSDDEVEAWFDERFQTVEDSFKALAAALEPDEGEPA